MVVSHSTLSTIGLSLQAILLFTGGHFTHVSYLFCCRINYVKDLCCEGGLLLSILDTAKIQQGLLLYKFRTIGFVVSPAITRLHV